MTKAQGYTYCSNQGMELAVILNTEELTAALMAVSSSGGATYVDQKAITSATCFAYGSWRWGSDGPVWDVNGFPINTGQVTDNRDTCSPGHSYSLHRTGVWDCDEASEPHKVLCSRVRLPPATPPATPPPSPPGLPPPPPSPAPGLPPPSPGAVVHQITTTFTISGSVGDYDAAAQTAIKTVLAAEAKVSTSAVSLTFTAGSVLVAADIFFATQAGATTAASSLSAGVLADATSLQTALNAEFAASDLGLTTSVQEIQSSPQVIDTSGGSVLVVGIVASAAVVLIVAVGFFFMRRKAKTKVRGKSAPQEQASTPAGAVKVTPQESHHQGLWDCFLTHDWGNDELKRNNHQRVGKINEALKKRGYKTWFDEEMMVGNINKVMTNGIEGSKTVIAFITNRYLEKVNGDGEQGDDDNCKFEFDYADRRKGNSAMYPVVMEPRCRDPRSWTGIVGGKLGGKLYADFTDDELLERAVDAIAKYIDLELQRQREVAA